MALKSQLDSNKEVKQQKVSSQVEKQKALDAIKNNTNTTKTPKMSANPANMPTQDYTRQKNAYSELQDYFSNLSKMTTSKKDIDNYSKNTNNFNPNSYTKKRFEETKQEAEKNLDERYKTYNEKVEKDAGYNNLLYGYTGSDGKRYTTDEGEAMANNMSNRSVQLETDFNNVINRINAAGAVTDEDRQELARISEEYKTLKYDFDEISSWKYGYFDYQSEYDNNAKTINDLLDQRKQLYLDYQNGVVDSGTFTQGITDIDNKRAELTAQNDQLKSFIDDQKVLQDKQEKEFVDSEEATDKQRKEYYEMQASYDDSWMERRLKYLSTIPARMAGGVTGAYDLAKDFILDKYGNYLKNNAEANLNDPEVKANAPADVLENYNNTLEKAQKYIDFSANAEDNWSTNIKRFVDNQTSQVYFGAENEWVVAQYLGEALDQTAQFLSEFYLSGGNETLSLLVMAAESGSDVAYRDLDEGRDINTAALHGALSGTLSYLTEKIGMDNFVNAISGRVAQQSIGNAIEYIGKAVLKQGTAEGLEEVAEWFFTPLVDSIAASYEQGRFVLDTSGWEQEDPVRAFTIAFLSASVTGLWGGVSGTINYYNNIVDGKGAADVLAARKYMESVLEKGGLTDFEERFVRQNIAMATEALNNFDGNSKLGSKVKYVNDFNNQDLRTASKVEKYLAVGLTPEFEAKANEYKSYQEAASTIQTVTQAMLEANNIQGSAEQYLSMTPEQRSEVTKVAEAIAGTKFKIAISDAVVVKGKVETGFEGLIMHGDTIVISPNITDGVLSTVIHEMTHTIEKTDAYQFLSNYVLTNEYKNNQAQLFKDIRETQKLYKESVHQNLSEEAAKQELVANIYQKENYFGNEEFLDTLFKYNESAFTRFYEGVKSFLNASPEAAARYNYLEAFRKVINDNQAQQNKGVKFSIKVNSDGIKLSREQAKYFKNSKIVDEEGNLLVVYHGTMSNFTVFDRTKTRANMDIQGNFFSPWEIDAGGYGTNVNAYYLNITNPADFATAYKALQRFKGQDNAGVKAREYLESLGYDGVNNDGEEYIAFNANQIKRIDNFNPTDNDDVRYKIRPQLRNDLESVFNNEGKFGENNEIIIGTTSDFLADIIKMPDNIKRLDVTMPASKAYSNMASKEKAIKDGKPSGKYNYHDLGVDGLIEVLTNSETPLAVFATEGNQSNKLSLITSLNNNEEKLYKVGYDINTTGFPNGKAMKVNKDVTAYRATPINQIVKAAEDGRLLYLDKKSWIYNAARAQFSSEADITNFDYNITQFWEKYNDFEISIVNKPKDSSGRTLSKQVADHFSNSKVVDENGNLKVMYTGSPNDFTVFDKKKARKSGLYGAGFYFTESKSAASTYGNVMEVYLNITNPVDVNNETRTITDKQLRKFVTELAENEDYGIENYGYGATVDSIIKSLNGKSDFALLQDLNATCVGDMVEAVELFNKVNGTNYDGIIAKTETVAFYPNQIKLVDNQNPTANDDIRFKVKQRDENYLKAINSNNLEKAQKMVDDYANEKLSDSQARNEEGKLIPFYHGTNQANFTVFDPKFSDDNISLFFTDNPNVANTYSYSQSNGRNVTPGRLYKDIKTIGDYNNYMAEVGENSRIIKVTQDDVDAVVKSTEEIKNSKYYKYNKQLNDSVAKDEIEGIKNALGKYIVKNGDNYITKKVFDTAEDIINDFKNDAFFRTQRWGNRYKTYLDIKNPLIIKTSKQITANLDVKVTVETDAYDHNFKVVYEDEYGERVKTEKFDTLEELVNSLPNKQMKDEVSNRYNQQYEENPDFIYFDDYIGSSKQTYTEPGNWQDLNYKGMNTTREVTKYAKENGYDGVIFQEIYDIGGFSGGFNIEPSNVAVAFNSNQVKSANAVVYDDNGNIVPLSERFNEQNDDVRYKVKPNNNEEVQPTSNKWKRGTTFEEAKRMQPTLFDTEGTTETEANGTQITTTVKTYNKVFELLKKEDFDGKILDASSGKGVGTLSGRNNYSFDVEDVEPYPGSDYKPMYTNYNDIDEKYDVIISNAVLNVTPQDQRDFITRKMGELLKDGGRMFVNVRGTDVLSSKNKIAFDESNMEYFIPGSRSYQKGFTKAELKAYLEDALGEDFTVRYPTASEQFGGVSVIAEKNANDARYKVKKKAKAQLSEREQNAKNYFLQELVVDPDSISDTYVKNIVTAIDNYTNAMNEEARKTAKTSLEYYRDELKQITGERYEMDGELDLYNFTGRELKRTMRKTTLDWESIKKDLPRSSKEQQRIKKELMQYFTIRSTGGVSPDVLIDTVNKTYNLHIDSNGINMLYDLIDIYNKADLKHNDNSIYSGMTQLETLYGFDEAEWDRRFDKLVQDMHDEVEQKAIDKINHVFETADKLLADNETKFSDFARANDWLAGIKEDALKWTRKDIETEEAYSNTKQEFIDNADKWMPNYQIVAEKYGLFDKENFNRALYEITFEGSMEQSTASALMGDIIRNDFEAAYTNKNLKSEIDEFAKDVVAYFAADEALRENAKTINPRATVATKLTELRENNHYPEGTESTYQYKYEKADKIVSAREKTKEIREQYNKKYEPLAFMFSQMGTKQTAANLNWKTFDQVLDVVCGTNTELRVQAEEVLGSRVRAMHQEYVGYQQELNKVLRKLTDDFGIKAGTKESRLAQFYREQHTNKTITNERGQLEWAPYTEADLLRDANYKMADGRMAYDVIKEAVDYIGPIMDELQARQIEIQTEIYGDPEGEAEIELANKSSAVKMALESFEMAKKEFKANPTPQMQRMYENAERQLNKAVREFNKAVDDRTSHDDVRRQLTPYRQNYMHHVKEQTFAEKLKQAWNTQNTTPTQLVGIENQISPNTAWAGYMAQQGFGDYTPDLINSFAAYAQDWSRVAASNPFINEFRRFQNKLREYSYGTENNGLVEYMDDWLNGIAGKRASLDKSMSKYIPNNVMNTARVIVGQAKKAALMFNVHSALVQVANVPNAMGILETNGKTGDGAHYIGVGIAEYLNKNSEARKALDRSIFLSERFMDFDTKDIRKTAKINELAGKMMTIGDKMGSEIIWMGAYKQAQEKNVKDAIKYADDITRRSVAGRGIGEVPPNLRSTVFNLFLPFQVETNNQWQTFKSQVSNKQFDAICWTMIGSLVLNSIFSFIGAGDVLPEFISPIIKELKKMFKKKQDGEDVSGKQLLLDILGGEAAEFISMIPGGADIINLGLDPDDAEKIFGKDYSPSRYGTTKLGAKGIGELFKDVTATGGQVLDGNWYEALRQGAKTGKDFTKNFAPGGAQAIRTLEGLQSMGALPQLSPNKLEITPVNYTDSGKIRYVNDQKNVFDWLKAGAFGKWNTSAAQEYIDSGFKTKGATATNLFDVINDVISDDKKAMDIAERISKTQSLKDADGKTITNSKALQVRQELEDAGVYNEIVKKINDEQIDPSKYGLSKTVINMSSSEAEQALNDAKKKSEKSSGSTSKSKASTGTKITGGTNTKMSKKTASKKASLTSKQQSIYDSISAATKKVYGQKANVNSTIASIMSKLSKSGSDSQKKVAAMQKKLKNL